MGILSAALTPVARSTQVISPHTHKLRAESFASDESGHRFTTCFEQAVAPRRKDEVVVFVLGSTGTGKSKLAIDLASHFGGEVVNSDKMQVYAGLDVITNKVTDEECAGIPHHLIAGVHPDAEFTASDFRREATRAVEAIVARGRLAIVAGGSNSYLEELVDGDGGKFRSKYECCFVWIDVELPVLHLFVSARVDKMVEMGLVEEARGVFEPEAEDYSKGIRKSIGVPEMDRFFRAEGSADEGAKARMLQDAIEEIKENTRKLTCNQLKKIHRLSTLRGWDVHRVEATEALQKRGDREGEEVWNRMVREPSIKIVHKFLNGEYSHDTGFLKKIMSIAAVADANQVSEATATAAAIATATATTTIKYERKALARTN